MHSVNEISVNVEDVVHYLRVTGHFSPYLREVVERKWCVQAAEEEGFEVDDEELQRTFDNFRRTLGLEDGDATREWLEANGLELEDIEKYLEQNVLIYKWKNHLGEQADTSELVQSELVQEDIRTLAYEQWLDEQLQ